MLGTGGLTTATGGGIIGYDGYDGGDGVEYVTAPKTRHSWKGILSSIPAGQAVKLEFPSRSEARLAGERARHYVRSNKLGKLHTKLEGGQVDASGVWIEGVAYLLLWLTED